MLECNSISSDLIAKLIYTTVTSLHFKNDIILPNEHESPEFMKKNNANFTRKQLRNLHKDTSKPHQKGREKSVQQLGGHIIQVH